jgi:diketogulonate reductase-like aldo/keto reductase
MVNIPPILYGTAWKEDQTEHLTFQALESGFRGIDTANQRKHYFEEAVGKGINRFLESKQLARTDLFLQTKFTFSGGQDHRLPYDPNASYEQQVIQSFEKSLQHLQTTYIDSYVLHGPFGQGIGSEDLEVWNAMEKLHREGKVKFLGVSNVNVRQLQKIYEHASIKPAFVQNRCYAIMGWDKAVRDFCKDSNIQYQGFSLLTANSRELANAKIQTICKKYGKTVAQVVFRFSQQIGILPLTGTTSKEHMLEGMGAVDFDLTPDEIRLIECIAI